MKKNITIGSVTFPVQSSAFTPFAYKNMTGRELLTDLMTIQDKITEAQADEKKAPEIISAILANVWELAYTMYAEADKNAVAFPEWLKQFDGILDDNSWLAEVVATAAATFRRNAEAD